EYVKNSFNYQEHEAVSYAYKVVSVDPEFRLTPAEDSDDGTFVMYSGENAGENFIDSLQTVASQIYNNYITQPKPMPVLSEKEEEEHLNATVCHICEKEFKEDDIREHDHDHILGNYRGAAHQYCNLQYKITASTWKLPVFFHNLRSYDAHIIVKALSQRHKRIRVIPNNIEKYLSISVNQLQFLDSLQFTFQSLDNLSKTLSTEELIYTRRAFQNDDEFVLLKEKGVFPYDYFDSLQRFTDTELPCKEGFFNKLNDTEITDEQYAHAQIVWETFKRSKPDFTFKDYHDIYLKTDVLLLTDFFEKFRNTCLRDSGLDAAHYYSSPGMSWDCAMKLTGVELELFLDEAMYTFIERGIRGGVSMISTRFAKANNPACKVYDATKPTTYLLYLDANNLYGCSMVSYLPTHGFRFLSENEFSDLNIETLSPEAEDGYIYEVDLEYPEELHDLHSDYPLCVEPLEITESMMSPFQQKFPKQPPQIKLTPNLLNKRNYIVHYRNLQLYLKLGMKLTKIHKILTFKQSPWLKKYIDYNTSQRALATSTFEKDYYKLKNNSFFGKTSENLRNRVNVEIITDAKVAKRRVASILKDRKPLGKIW
ncbi:MAG: DNA polymerase, partial [Nitrosopumilus sp.]|nr:DNA polymerase [Nitrosopumilus sp.]